MPVTFDYAILNKVLFIRAPLRFCAPEAGNLLEELLVLMEQHGLAQVDCELSACNYLDSTVLGQMVALHRRLGPGNLTLTKPSPESRQILLIMGLDKLLNISEEPLPESLVFQTLTPQRNNSAQDILNAHTLLSQISPENAKRFETLIKTLEQSIHRE